MSKTTNFAFSTQILEGLGLRGLSQILDDWTAVFAKGESNAGRQVHQRVAGKIVVAGAGCLKLKIKCAQPLLLTLVPRGARERRVAGWCPPQNLNRAAPALFCTTSFVQLCTP